MIQEEYMKVRPKNKGQINVEKNKGQFAQLEKRISDLHSDNDTLREEAREHMNKIYKLEDTLKETTSKLNQKTSQKDEVDAK
jgi:septal ring factor EnvC (AmiA/AmiB activator)